METVKVQWHAVDGWTVQPQGESPQPFDQWAQALPDLTPVRMVLSARNYVCHWLNMPGVAARHVARALPFALEEHLINDLAQYHIVGAGSQAKKNRAYVMDSDCLERLLEICAHHHVQLRELLAETQVVARNSIVRSDGGWLINVSGEFEGWVSDGALTPVLESLLGNGQTWPALTLVGDQLDGLQLLKTTLETSYPDQIEALTLSIEPSLWQFDDVSNLLSGRFQPKTVRAERSAPVWWRGLALASLLALLLYTVLLYNDYRVLKAHASGVRTATTQLYQQLFPGERIRSLERQIREKLSDSPQSARTGFVAQVQRLAQVRQQHASAVQLLSLRYNERQDELVIDVKAKDLNDLQTLRQALEQAGMVSEIASATNDEGGVKGRLKIGGGA